jgi:hypothetical protein
VLCASTHLATESPNNPKTSWIVLVNAAQSLQDDPKVEQGLAGTRAENTSFSSRMRPIRLQGCPVSPVGLNQRYRCRFDSIIPWTLSTKVASPVQLTVQSASVRSTVDDHLSQRFWLLP